MANRLRLEKTLSWQLENTKGAYCATTYSKRDAQLIKPLAESIPNLVCLPKRVEHGKQPKGIYLEVKGYPQVEVYDGRLAKKVRAIKGRLRGE